MDVFVGVPSVLAWVACRVSSSEGGMSMGIVVGES